MARAMTLYDHDPNTSAPLWLVREKGKLICVSGNQSLALDNPASIWVVFSGRVDLFAVQLDQGKDTGQRRWLFRAETGQALFGFDTKIQCPNLRIIASSTPGTTLLELSRARLQSLATMSQSGPDVIRFLEQWVKALSNASTSQLLPRNYETLVLGQENTFSQDTAVLPPASAVWVQHHTGSSSLTNTQTLSQATQNTFLPICRPMWLQTESESTIAVISTQDLVVQDPTWKGLDCYHGLVLDRLYNLAIQTQKAQEERLEAKAQAEQELLSGALRTLATVLDKGRTSVPLPERVTHDPLVIACQWVCQAIGVPAETIARAPEAVGSASVALDRAAQAMRVQKRRVVLHGEWWQQDSGPLLAFVGDQAFERPVALLPRSSREYELCDPVDQTRTLVTQQVAEKLYPFAYTFYRPFPARALGAWDLARFVQPGNRNDLRTFLLAGAAGGALALLVPLATGWLLNELIPDNELSQITQVFAALVVSAIASTAFHFARSIALVRIQARVSASLQSAIWDRLLNLPTSFFRGFSAGDLASRAMGIETIRRTLTTTTLSAIFAGVFSVLNIGMMFYYSPRLAWISALLVFAVIATATIVGYAQIGHQRHLTRIRGQLYGLVLQLVTGITKLRVAGAERRAFAFWSRGFRAQKDRDYRAQQTVNVLSTLNAVYPTMNAVVLFALAAATSQESGAMSAGDFVAFYAAFGQLLSAGLQTSDSLLAISNIAPIYERAKPILETLPEVDDLRADPGELLGTIDVDHVDFSYSSSGPQILHDLSLHIEPGEFVALVGPSGSGKSTLFRLLLGFETPQAGTILYDGQELTKLNIRAVRRQIGVVLQTGKLVRGTVLENIVGSAPLTVGDARRAARLVGLDRDIERMPMGMYTVISTGGSTLSGGQRQRILIARAIVHRPRILLFDEATSALDNITQATVSQSLSHIQATRIVIAHRLSTIRQADRIVVLEHGRIVQIGTYAELSSQQGLFTDLAKRQTL